MKLLSFFSANWENTPLTNRYEVQRISLQWGVVDNRKKLFCSFGDDGEAKDAATTAHRILTNDSDGSFHRAMLWRLP